MFCLTAYSGILHLCKESFLTMFQKFKKLLKLNIDKEHLVNYTGKYLIKGQQASISLIHVCLLTYIADKVKTM